ncbi:C40 family peptidase [Dysgonomonas sp. Marseille-P4677]|uniref:C40 family peptidase n=1 Tax=Dysgonomonas sp. Marseille-P4677 TaxID=2364790 RepID=UPI0019124201|nr:C40 family peptidase [Dysgonomonas sp. Marseille-P4677]MBK5723097.1 C40 family peptidase [Dysgonomonas sp. Marseille-P4677]
MKKLFILFITILSSTFIFSQNVEKHPELKNIIDSIQQKYIPDKRVSVYEINISGKINSPILKGYISDKHVHNELNKAVKNKYKIFTDSIQLLPSVELGDQKFGVINLSVADIRTKGDFSAEMATQAMLGTPLRVLQKDGWYRIQTPDGYIAWTQQATFQPMNKEEFNIWTKSPKIIFTDYFGFGYQYPDKERQTVSDLVVGNILKYEGEEGDFYKVSYPDGRNAYILKSQSRKYNEWYASLNPTGENFVKESFKMMGIPYVWGGTSAKGMDCSGFTKTVLFLHGIILTRDASQQVNTGIPIDISTGYSNLQIGDLMFFGKKASDNKKERIRHVAFYIGNNEFIHASGCIRIGSLDPAKPNYDEVNTKEFIRASRVIGAIDTKGIWSIDNNPMYKVQP